MSRLLCLGEPLLELNARAPGPEGRTLYLEGHGGDASNVAVAAARQGASAGFLGAVGRDRAGASFRALWAREGVDATHVRDDPDHPTGLYLVTHGAQGHEFAFHRRGSAASRYRAADVPAAAVAEAGCVFASGISLAISETAADAALHAFALARAAGGRVAFDTNYRPALWPPARAWALIRAAAALAHVALPGLDDLRALAGIEDPDAALDLFLGLGCPVVALKMGAAGTYLGLPDRRVRVPPFPCAPVDATGAGDAFSGAFLARLLAGDAPEAAARYAACCAALSTEGWGAVAPVPDAARVRAALAAGG